MAAEDDPLKFPPQVHDKLANYCRERKCWASDFKYEDLVSVGKLADVVKLTN